MNAAVRIAATRAEPTRQLMKIHRLRIDAGPTTFWAKQGNG